MRFVHSVLSGSGYRGHSPSGGRMNRVFPATENVFWGSVAIGVRGGVAVDVFVWLFEAIGFVLELRHSSWFVYRQR